MLYRSNMHQWRWRIALENSMILIWLARSCSPTTGCRFPFNQIYFAHLYYKNSTTCAQSVLPICQPTEDILHYEWFRLQRFDQFADALHTIWRKGRNGWGNIIEIRTWHVTRAKQAYFLYSIQYMDFSSTEMGSISILYTHTHKAKKKLIALLDARWIAI